jgi:hypothetical protein
VGICTVYQFFVSAAATIVNLCALFFSSIAPEHRFVDAREALGGEEQDDQG